MEKKQSKITNSTTAKYTCYSCLNCGQEEDEDSQTCDNAHECYTMYIVEHDGYTRLTKGCYNTSDTLNRHICAKKTLRSKKAEIGSQITTDCCKGNICNSDSSSFMKSVERQEADRISTAASPHSTAAWTVLAFSSFAILALVLGLYLWRKFSRKPPENNCRLLGTPVPASLDIEASSTPYHDHQTDQLRATAAGDSTLRELFNGEVTSGSGSGLPLLVQRSMSKDIALLNCIGKGRYGEVWHAKWKGNSVAVKQFFSHEEVSWRRETEIYNTVMLRHDNVLAYFGSDVISVSAVTQLWLITQFHPLGSLYDFLSDHILSVKQALSILKSASAGMLHLHEEIIGSANAKPAIAHRDFKSKNILMKNPWTACIADLGLAVTNRQSFGRLAGDGRADDNTRRVGTRRYMAPEILDEVHSTNMFEQFARADIYSFGLVMWETCRRAATPVATSDSEDGDECQKLVVGLSDEGDDETLDPASNEGPKQCEGNTDTEAVDEFRVPFYDVVPSDPSFEDMRKVVVTDEYRPIFSKRWGGDEALSQVEKVIGECWRQNPAARLTALNIWKKLFRISESIKNDGV